MFDLLDDLGGAFDHHVFWLGLLSVAWWIPPEHCTDQGFRGRWDFSVYGPAPPVRLGPRSFSFPKTH